MNKISLRESAAMPPEGTYWVHVAPNMISVLRQMRTKMSQEGLEDLALSIKQSGQINPGIVVGLAKSEAVKYLNLINEMWGTEYSVALFTPVFLKELKGEYYLFLVAGHRRLKAVELGEVETFYCQLHLAMNFSKALMLQFQENLHEQVPPDDEARFLTFFWRQEKSTKTKLTLAEFARKMGKKPETVRRSVRFTSLPVAVQRLILPSQEFKKGMAFGILCELARLQEARTTHGKGYDERELMRLAYVLVVQQKTAKNAAAWVSTQIHELSGQGAMFELSIDDAVEGARKTVRTDLEMAVRTGTEHLRRVGRLHEEGGIEKVASGSTANAVVAAVALTTDIAPQIIDGVRGARHAPAAREAIKKTGT